VTQAEIDAALAQPLPWNAPKTVGDLLTLVFRDDWESRRKALESADSQEFTAYLRMSYTISPAEVVKAHLLRLMEVERQQRERG
jgi:hypothetical protein